MNNEQTVNSVGATSIDEQTAVDSEMLIPVIEEELTVGKRIVESGKVRISKQVREVEETVDVPLLHEQVSVERVTVNRVVEERLPTRYDGDTLIIPVIEERVFVEKRLVLVEELHIRKQTIETNQPQTVTLLKEEVEITRTAEGKNSVG